MLAADRIEEIRVGWERELERTYAGRPRTRASSSDPGESEPRVRLEAEMARRVHRLADLAAERLGCTDPFVLYQTPRERPHLTAQALLTERPFAIRLVGPVAKLLDDEALVALIGHELGHWLALGPRARPPSTIRDAWECGAPRETCRLAYIATELTADRFSLIACAGELEAMVRLEVAIHTLDCPRALEVEELAYLDELRRRVEAGQAGVGTHSDGLSTEHRLYASWLFWRSDLHRQLTGRGPGDLALTDVDARLRGLAEGSREGELQPAARGEVTPKTEAGSAKDSPNPWLGGLLGSHGGVTDGVLSERVRVTDGVLSERVRARAASLAGALRRIAGQTGADEGRAIVATSAPDAEVLADDEDLDDLERRFRALERQAERVPSEAGGLSEELETRFRELEAAAREGDDRS